MLAQSQTVISPFLIDLVSSSYIVLIRLIQLWVIDKTFRWFLTKHKSWQDIIPSPAARLVFRVVHKYPVFLILRIQKWHQPADGWILNIKDGFYMKLNSRAAVCMHQKYCQNLWPTLHRCPFCHNAITTFFIIYTGKYNVARKLCKVLLFEPIYSVIWVNLELMWEYN